MPNRHIPREMHNRPTNNHDEGDLYDTSPTAQQVYEDASSKIQNDIF